MIPHPLAVIRETAARLGRDPRPGDLFSEGETWTRVVSVRPARLPNRLMVTFTCNGTRSCGLVILARTR